MARSAVLPAADRRPTPHEEEIVIRSTPPPLLPDLAELYRYRHLLAALVRRNVRVQFDAMHLGWVWACTRPILYVLIFATFRNLSGAETHVSIPYPLYVYSGLVLWYYFLDATMGSSSALKREAGLLSKIYYPRIVAPLVPIFASLANLGISLIPMVILMAWFQVWPGVQILMLPFVLLQCVVLVLGVGTLFASLSLTSKDWERFLQFSLYLGMFVSPVIYSPDMIPGPARGVYLLNPMAGTLLAFRSAWFGEFAFPWEQWGYSVAVSAVTLLVGLWAFRRIQVELTDKL